MGYTAALVAPTNPADPPHTRLMGLVFVTMVWYPPGHNWLWPTRRVRSLLLRALGSSAGRKAR